MSSDEELDTAGLATAVLIQAAVKTGEIRAIAAATKRVLDNAAAELSNTAALVARTKELAHRAGLLRGLRHGFLMGLLCGAAVGACAAMFLRAVFA